MIDKITWEGLKAKFSNRNMHTCNNKYYVRCLSSKGEF